MNEREKKVYDKIKRSGCIINKIDKIGYPDFLVDNNFYIEVKNDDSKKQGINSLSTKQEKFFKLLNKPIKIIYVSLKNNKFRIEEFKPKKSNQTKELISIHETFTKDEYKILKKAKTNKSWHNFIMEEANNAIHS